ncbi:MAG: Clp protease N-terminal domain-containing protein, partial [Blastocatellia bacterium]
MPDGDDIRHALDLAIAEATSAGSEAVEPLHVLIGVLRLGDGVVDQAVAACGIDPVRLRRHLRGYARRTVRPTA